MAWGRKNDGGRQDDAMNEAKPAPDAAAPGENEVDQAIAKLTAERDELNQKYLRTVADYQNAQRRSTREQEEARRQGITSVVQNVLTVVDHFDLALMQDPSKATAEQIKRGVAVIRDELLKVLQAYGVQDINPAQGEEFDPHKHQAVMHTENEAVPPGHVVSTLQAGYALGDRVIRPARVSVRPNPEQPAGTPADL
jgi:molecular chaperone GrpE